VTLSQPLAIEHKALAQPFGRYFYAIYSRIYGHALRLLYDFIMSTDEMLFDC
jgi:hypothetical protein